MRSVLLCPGQGAQYVGMGRDVADEFKQAREVFEAVDEALEFSLSRLMWEGPEQELILTHNAQPAILTHSLAVHAVIGSRLDTVMGAGHSLGEYSAYSAACALGLTDAARIVRRRGELMLEAGKRRRGTMTAVIGLDVNQVTQVCRECSTADEVVVPANINAPDQVVVSGDPGAVERAGDACRSAGARRVLPLKVSGAFHSPLMGPAQRQFKLELDAIDLVDPRFPIVANASAEPVFDAATARTQLGAQLTSPVRWVESIERAVADARDNIFFVEMGPGKVLSGLLRRIAKGSRAITVATAADIHQFIEEHG